MVERWIVEVSLSWIERCKIRTSNSKLQALGLEFVSLVVRIRTPPYKGQNKDTDPRGCEVRSTVQTYWIKRVESKLKARTFQPRMSLPFDKDCCQIQNHRYKMRIVSTCLTILSAASLAQAFSPIGPTSMARGGSQLHSTAEKKEEKVEGKKAGKDAPPVNIGWDSHQAVEKIPDSLVREGDGPDGNYPMRSKFEKMCRDAQIAITKAIEDIDGEGSFQEDCWTRANGGGGMSRVLSGGKVFEKAGVNLSVVYGSMPQEALQAATERGVDRSKGMAPGERVPFFACGLSSVMHPKNPHCPTMHFNYRYFETDGGVWWFGGGTDITPCYVNEDDMKHFHGTYKEICDKHDPEYYKEFKAWADRYFVISHRNETRGFGGIFFDDQNNKDPDEHFAFSEECLNSVVKAYGPIIEKHKNDEFTEKEKEWQLMRRGRYVEFNLVYDRGTVFGLKTGGRIESILMSLPETARWEYNHIPEPGTPEYDFIDACKNPRDWV